MERKGGDGKEKKRSEVKSYPLTLSSPLWREEIGEGEERKLKSPRIERDGLKSK